MTEETKNSVDETTVAAPEAEPEQPATQEPAPKPRAGSSKKSTPSAELATLSEENERLRRELEEAKQAAEAAPTYQAQVERLRKDLADLRRDLKAKELESHRLAIVQALAPIATENQIPIPVIDYYLSGVKIDTLGTTDAQELFRQWIDGEGAAFKPKLVQPGPSGVSLLGQPSRPSGTITRSIKTSL